MAVEHQQSVVRSSWGMERDAVMQSDLSDLSDVAKIKREICWNANVASTPVGEIFSRRYSKFLIKLPARFQNNPQMQKL